MIFTFFILLGFSNIDLEVTIFPRNRCSDLREPLPPSVNHCAFLGDNVTILCSSPDTNEPGVITPNGETGRRDIVDIEERDSGMYTCSLNNVCGDTIESFYLAVFGECIHIVCVCIHMFIGTMHITYICRYKHAYIHTHIHTPLHIYTHILYSIFCYIQILL